MLSLAIENFFSDEIKSNQQRALKARIIYRFVLLCMVSSAFFSALYYYIGLRLSLFVVFSSFLVFIALFFSIRYISDTTWLIRSVLIICYVVITFLVIDTGGAASVVTPVYLAVPVLCFLFDSQKSARMAVIVCTLTILIIYAINYLGIVLPNNIPSSIVGLHDMAFKLFIFLFIVSLLMVYNKQIREAYDMTIQLNRKLESSQAKMQEMAEQAINFSKHLTEVEDDLTKAFLKERESKKQLQMAQAKLVENEKMASLGQLTAGVAHEINNPVNFIQSGVEGLMENIEDFKKFENARNKALMVVAEGVENGRIKDPEGVCANTFQQIEKWKRSIAYEEVMEEVGELAISIQNGATRTTEIVKGLKTFSRLDENAWKPVNLPQNIDSTLVLLKNKLKERVEIIKEYKETPEIEGLPGKLNQVFMNLLVNAIQAIEGTGAITIGLDHLESEDLVRVSISDTGKGMPTKIQKKIFEPFFTTKDVGEGTGLGLAIAMGIIEDHHARLSFESEEGKGTTFFIDFPIIQTKKKEDE